MTNSTHTVARRRKPEQISEKAIHEAVVAHWRAFGVPGSFVATIPNMRAHGQAGLTKGVPDLMVISPKLGSKTAFLELKRVGGHLTDEQADFGTLCMLLGIPWAVAYGRVEPIKVLEAWGVVKRTVMQ